MRANSGFTLVEVAVVLAILGLLSALALPSYRESVRKSHRADAHISLSSLATQQEKFYFRGSTYADDFSDIVAGLPANTRSIDSNEGYYTITLSASTDLRSWSMTAAAQGDQLDDIDCNEITLNSFGAKTARDWRGDVSDACW